MIISIIFTLTAIIPLISGNEPTINNMPNSNHLFVGGTGVGNYSTIQSAINDASNGDVIFVYNGTYYENIIINKSISLLGENRENTIIDGEENGNDVIEISVDYVNISSFTIQNSGSSGITQAGIFLYASNIILTNNIIFNNECGIRVASSEPYISNNNVIENNNISNNNEGIVFESYSNISNTIVTNNSLSNNFFGIGIIDRFYDNQIINNTFTDCGMVYEASNGYCSGNIIVNNTVNDLPLIFLNDSSDLKFDSNVGQIILENCSNITIENLILLNNSASIQLLRSKNCKLINNYCSSFFGLYFTNSDENLIVNNSLFDNYAGLLMYNSDSNLLMNNKFQNNVDYAIYGGNNNRNFILNNTFSSQEKAMDIGGSKDNKVIYNSFINSSILHVESYALNQWDAGYQIGGNYWDDYTGLDANGDGIGDSPYIIMNGYVDNYPLMTQPQNFPNIVFVNDDFDDSYENWQVLLFDTIQDGINAVDENGIVYVYDGTYYENLLINKTIDLIGEDKNNTIIDGKNNGDVIQILSDSVNISNFFIHNTSSYVIKGGIIVEGKNALISSCILQNNGVGIKIQYSNNSLIQNCIFNDTRTGIILRYTDNNSINNCIFTNNNVTGLSIEFSTLYNVISSCKVENNIMGINILTTNYLLIQDSQINNNSLAGIDIDNGSLIEVNNCDILRNGWHGIYIHETSRNTITNNNISDNSNHGIYSEYYYSNQTTVSNNVITNNGKSGIFLLKSYNWDINNNIISNNTERGIRTFECDQNNISRNNINYNENEGVYLVISNNNTFHNNSICNNTYGIKISYSNSNYISKNIIHENNNWYGIHLTSDSNNNTITDSIICGNVYGIFIDISSMNNNILKNSISNNSAGGIWMDESINNTIIFNNFINYNNGDGIASRSLNTIINENHIKNNDRRGVYLTSSNKYTQIVNNTITNNSNEGIEIGSSQNLCYNNKIFNNHYGLMVFNDDNNITNNIISNNSNDGIQLSSSCNNTISCNTIIDNEWSGIQIIFDSNNNSIFGNKIENNHDYGISLYMSYNNLIFNNYFNNSNNADDQGNNFWNISKTFGSNIIGGPYLGGNFWIDYTGTDITGDGLGDTGIPYGPGDYHPLTPYIDINQSSFNRGFPIRHAADGDWAGAQNYLPTLGNLTKCEIYLRKFGAPEFNLTVELREDSIDGPVLDTLVFTPAEVPSSWTWLELDFTDITVTPGVDYFIKCPPAPSGVTTSFGYEWGYAFGNQYDDGAFWFTRDGGNLWRDLPTMYEMVFKTYGYS